MTTNNPLAFAICAAAMIPIGGVKSFQLSVIRPTGERRPFAIFVLRSSTGSLHGYVNVCPHEGRWLNVGNGDFHSDDGTRLRCGRHGAKFDVETGLCVSGPCQGTHLEPLALLEIDGDICLCGVDLVEDDRFHDPYDDFDDTMEIMIHPG